MSKNGKLTLANLFVNILALLELISLPITCLTLGLFEIVISGFILKLVDMLMASVYFSSTSRYFITVIIIAIVNGLFGTEKE